MITSNQAIYLAKKFKLDLDIIPLKWWKYALDVELEHGTKFGSITNVTKNNLIKTAQIAIAHLIEMPDYYQRLYKMEKAADKYWFNKNKPNIFYE